MASIYYPEITADSLLPVHFIIDKMLDDPLALERPACKYTAETVASLRSLWSKMEGRSVREVVEDEEIRGLDEELGRLLGDLRKVSHVLEPNDAKEQLNYVRTAAVLIAKITDLQERMANIKSVTEFQAKVVAVFDEILSPEQRTQAVERLERK